MVYQLHIKCNEMNINIYKTVNPAIVKFNYSHNLPDILSFLSRMPPKMIRTGTLKNTVPVRCGKDNRILMSLPNLASPGGHIDRPIATPIMIGVNSGAPDSPGWPKKTLKDATEGPPGGHRRSTGALGCHQMARRGRPWGQREAQVCL